MKPLITILLIFSALILIWSMYPIVLLIINPNNSSNDFAQFGDSYGGLNTLFSGLAFAGILISLRLQSKDLELNRGELKLTREELELTRQEIGGQTIQLKAQADLMQKQTEQVSKQAFEATFFQMMSLHNDIVTNTKAEKKSGREAFSETLYEYEVSLEFRKMREGKEERDYDEEYNNFYDDVAHKVGHYFRNIYQILNFIDNSDVKNKKFYTNILRAQLSTPELGLLLINGASKHGKDKHKPLLELYEFFEHLPYTHVIPSDIYKEYSSKAYGKTNTELLELIKKPSVVIPKAGHTLFL